MSTGAALEVADAALGNVVPLEGGVAHEKTPVSEPAEVATNPTDTELLRGPNGEEYPSAEDLLTLRRIRGDVSPLIYTIAFVELCERFAYYGTTAVFVNFIQRPLPDGSTTGASGTYGQSGALNRGQQTSTGLNLFNSFWAYITPVLGGYIADTFWGRFKTINYGIFVCLIGHVIIIVSAIPNVIANPNGSLACFVIGLILFGTGTGLFKSNISPLVAEQYEHKQPHAVIKTLASGERVIVDPVLTISIIYMRFYFFINAGALVGQIAMVYAEKYVGFWLAYLLPTILFLTCPVIMLLCRNMYHKSPPTGSVVGKALGLLFLAHKKRWSWSPTTLWANWKRPGFWDDVKPSRLGEDKPEWMTFDDHWVDEVRRGFKACSVFVWYPLWWLCYNQLNNNLVSQAGTMLLNGVPNDVVNNLDPFALLIFIPICDKGLYPLLERMGIKFTPIKKITAGFWLGSISMVVAAIIQHYIYVKSPCGYQASNCDTPPDLSVWAQTPAYVLIAFSEICASITGLEYAFTKAPKNMRSLVMGLFFFASAFSSALGQAWVPLANDPLQEWLYGSVAIISGVAGFGFWFTFRDLDKEEQLLNTLPDSVFQGSKNAETIDIEAAQAAQAEQDKIREAQGLTYTVDTGAAKV